MSDSDYHIVRNANGSASLGCRATGEVMHPLIGPEAEARRLYVDGLKLRERAAAGRLRIWDVGMGAAANALVALEALGDVECRLEIISFDRTDAALRFARAHPEDFGFVARQAEAVEQLLERGEAEFETGRASVKWTFHQGDFLESAADCPAPEAVFFDPWSPLRNSGMWTLGVFGLLHSRTEAGRPCALATYSRATCVRAALLLAGFYVGRGPGAGAKEESTVAATDPRLLDAPLPASWLDKAARSHSAKPLYSDAFTQEPLTPGMLEQLRAHPQFE